jgi:hypothetical protein
MTHFDLAINCIMFGVEVVLCLLIYVRGVPRRLPFFAAYATLLLIGTPVTLLVYRHFGFRSATSYFAVWTMVGLQTFARGVAIAELCRYGLHAYRGIWEVTWRVLLLLAMIFLAHAARDAWGQPNWISMYILTIERDLEISSIVILFTILFIRRYYGLSLEPLQQWIAIGMSAFSIINICNNTVVRYLLAGFMANFFQMRTQVESANEWWNAIRHFAFVLSIGIWCFAMRKPLPAPAQVPELLPESVYGELSSALNLRLRAFNDRLLELLKT